MAFGPENSAIRVSQSLEEQIASATSQSEISALLRAAAVSQGAARPDAYDNNVLHPTNQPRPQRFAKVLKINGEQKILEADSEAELAQKETAMYRELFAGGEQQPQVEQPRDENGRFVSQEEPDAQLNAAERAELDLRFKRGEISAADFIEQSGAMDEYLERRGVSLEALQAVSNTAFEQSWAEATDQFLQRHPDWPGLESNKTAIGTIIEQAGWTEAENKLQALESAYQYALDNNLLVANPEIEAHNKLAEAKSASELNEILQAFRPAGSSSMFGR